MSDRPGQATGGPGAPGEAAAARVAPDPLTASLLEKHAAGEHLTPSEYGKLGAAKKKGWFGIFARKSDAAAQSAQARPGQPAAVAAVAPGQASADSLPDVRADVRADAILAQRTAGALLKRCDAITQRWVLRHAAKAGATGKMADEFRSAAALSTPDKELLTDLAPDILAEMGVSPRQFPIVTAAAVIGLHAWNLWQCVDELKELQTKARAERLVQEHKTEKVIPVTLPAVERPADPPGIMKVFGEDKK